MSCGLSDDQLFILNILYTQKCLAKNRSYHLNKLKGQYCKKYSSNFKKAIQKLLNDGYITPIRKTDIKYYISNIPAMSYALSSHGYSVTKGKKRPL